MSTNQQSIRIELERVQSDHMAALQTRCRTTQSIHRTTIERFIADVNALSDGADGELVVSESALLEWLITYAHGQSPGTFAHRLSALLLFFDTLKEQRILGANRIVDFKVQHNGHSWDAIARALQSPDPAVTLAALKTPTPIRGPLFQHVADYIQLHRSLGKKYLSHAQILRDLDEFLANQSVAHTDEISADVMNRWSDSLSCSRAIRLRKERLASRFFEHLNALEVMASNPLARLIDGSRIPRTTLKPFIYTRDQIVSVLQKAKQLPSTSRFPLQAETCHTMLALLYCLGLRHGEVRRLCIRDLDFRRGTLMIRETKFHKSRCIPFGPKVANRLETFLQVRRTILPPLNDDDPLFVSRWRKPVSNRVLSVVLPKILRELGITKIAGQTRNPRVHDFRHTFAVHRLLRWYRSGVDVQSRLPLLSTFMGHLNLKSTEVYLTISMELLSEASTRFHRCFGYQFDEEVKP